jgi:hypothetical protein
MTKAQIKEIQTKIGVEADGFWGPISTRACEDYLRMFMPNPNPWPNSDQASLTAFYGKPGDESQHTRIDVTGLGVEYDGKTVNSILCHKKVGPSLQSVIRRLNSNGYEEILAKYAGCYNNRSMRGGSTPSLHARAAAIDFWPEKNGNGQHWPTSAMMPLEVMEIFAGEGWLSAGAFWSRDAMHFEATSR